jgi:two-component system, LytTR family, sensor kinase
MTISLRKYFASSRTHLDLNVFIPLFLILTLIALVSSFQAYYNIHTGTASLPILLRILLSRLLYSWYFSILALVVQWHSKRIQLARKTFAEWFLIHLTTLMVSFFIHETLTLGADALIWGIKPKATLLFVLFNNPSVWIETLVYILFLLSFSLMEYRRMSQENEIRCSQLEVQLIRSKLQEIRSKIQPTFLFNTLQTILSLIRTHKNKDANHILSLLSDFLRTTIYDNERDEITLEEEVRFLNQYLEVEKVRSRYTFDVHEDIERSVSNAVVPNFILQPIVEELVYRNSGREAPRHEIIVRAYKAGGQLEVIIEDHGMENDGDQLDEKEKGIVLDITKERLLHLYGDQQNLTVQMNKEGGALVKIRIPFREMVVDSERAFVVESIF